VVPRFELGVPDSWAGWDPADPPTFETEAEYLEHHGLLAPEERRALGIETA
jgi:hypothetical protein